MACIFELRMTHFVWFNVLSEKMVGYYRIGWFSITVLTWSICNSTLPDGLSRPTGTGGQRLPLWAPCPGRGAFHFRLSSFWWGTRPSTWHVLRHTFFKIRTHLELPRLVYHNLVTITLKVTLILESGILVESIILLITKFRILISHVLQMYRDWS